MKRILVTGGAGFIGSNFIIYQRNQRKADIVNLDCLTYAANLKNLECLAHDRHYRLIIGSIADRDLLRSIFAQYQPEAVVNFAAESHVDRSIESPGAFIQTNVVGTFHLLEETRLYWTKLDAPARQNFRFLHISTDEVYGTLGPNDPPFTEDTPYAPNSPYAASKAAADHLVRAYHHTYGLPTLTTNCSNNYGPRQFPEKLIPLMILNAREGKSLPVYGDGSNIRDWLFVEDHCEAVDRVLESGSPGETYNVGGRCEKSNIDIVKMICDRLDAIFPDSSNRPHSRLVTFVEDRPGHDWRYAIDCSKIESELGWRPRQTFESGLLKTVGWYLENTDWVESIKSGEYSQWIERQYGTRR
ncbi:MAG: dTDP-glucose 4,6-dehydratase [Syntrophobacteraceae bacterium]